MRRTRPILVASALVAAAAMTGLGAPAAQAEAPSQAGWWTQANPGSVSGSPTPPAPPDVPAGGLLVEGGTNSVSGSSDSGPTAFGAVVYPIPTGQTVRTLTLAVAPGSATTPATTLELCPLSAPTLNAEEGGPMTDAPTYRCSTNVTAAPSSSGNSYSFNVANLVSDGALAVAILPTSPTDRVVLSKPDDASLPLQASFSGSGQGTSTDFSGTAGNGASGGSPTAGAAQPSTGAAPEGSTAMLGTFTPAVPTQPAASAPATPLVPPTPAAPSASAGSRSPAAASVFPTTTPTTGGAHPLVAAGLIVAALIGAAVWLAVGRAAARAGIAMARPTSE